MVLILCVTKGLHNLIFSMCYRPIAIYHFMVEILIKKHLFINHLFVSLYNKSLCVLASTAHILK